MWWTSHVKERDQTDLFTGASYTQLTASMTMRYFNSIRDISHLIGFGYYDRSIQKIEVGEVNPVTKKKKTREITTSENRKIKFRDDSLVADAKSRFSSIVDEINLDTDEFIQAVEAAIKEASTSAPSTPAYKKLTHPKEDPVDEPEEDFEDDVTEPKVAIDDNNMPWDMDERYKKNIAVETVSLLGESKLMCLALFSYMCWSIISQKPLSLVPVFALCVLITVDVIWRTIRISKYKKP